MSSTLSARLRRSAAISIGDDAPFHARLAETVEWCLPRARLDDPRGSLRNDQWQPRPLATNRAETVNYLLRSRGHRRKSSDGIPAAAASADEGRLLAYFPDAELSDGAAELETEGFFDVFNTPPWDTWVGLFHPPGSDLSYGLFVVCWVPPQFIPVAQRGIDVNPETCIDWLVDGESEHARAAVAWLARMDPTATDIGARAR